LIAEQGGTGLEGELEAGDRVAIIGGDPLVRPDIEVDMVLVLAPVCGVLEAESVNHLRIGVVSRVVGDDDI
jgi:hypothetical protein